MATHTNSWAPDTCGCKVEFQWNDATPETTTPKRLINGCPEHSNLSDLQTFYDTIMSENTRKNQTVNRFIDPVKYPSLAETISKDGNNIKQLKIGIEIKWSFTGSDDARILNIDLTNAPLSKSEKTEVQAWADSQFSSGKVVII